MPSLLFILLSCTGIGTSQLRASVYELVLYLFQILLQECTGYDQLVCNAQLAQFKSESIANLFLTSQQGAAETILSEISSEDIIRLTSAVTSLVKSINEIKYVEWIETLQREYKASFNTIKFGMVSRVLCIYSVISDSAASPIMLNYITHVLGQQSVQFFKLSTLTVACLHSAMAFSSKFQLTVKQNALILQRMFLGCLMILHFGSEQVYNAALLLLMRVLTDLNAAGWFEGMY